MRLVMFELASPTGPLRRAGAIDGDRSIVDLNLAFRSLLRQESVASAARIADALVPPDLLEIIRGGERALAAAREALAYGARAELDEIRDGRVRHRPADVRLLAPLPRPNSLRDFLVVEAHIRNARKGQELPAEWFNMPVYYKGNVEAIYGPDDEIPWPPFTEKFDYELEVCAVIGRAGRAIKAEQAGSYVFGYTIFNDWSARDIQRREMTVGLGPAQGKDFANSIGPCVTTADEFDLANAKLRARIDGELWSEGTLGAMRFTFPEIIEWISMAQTLQPGDLLGSGTVGRGCGLELDRWVAPGSVVELSVDGIGVLRNRVGQRPPGELVRNARRSPRD
ncbi:MAG TPA: fumarylacetoacetate hydrolase family protein [Candidatus Limnocylindria bacterium]|jgi:2-keto-4-pentenoate hydratase/2-oxohepta-3-ene-1,7-dioic acid hydratase in catechol pathway|nr:fumarylacetoacetate hydrolase family protein [Candidatus Limnocylindria bacterium]